MQYGHSTARHGSCLLAEMAEGLRGEALQAPRALQEAEGFEGRRAPNVQCAKNWVRIYVLVKKPSSGHRNSFMSALQFKLGLLSYDLWVTAVSLSIDQSGLFYK